MDRTWIAALFREFTALDNDPVAAEMFERKLAALPLGRLEDLAAEAAMFAHLAERVFAGHPQVRPYVKNGQS